MSTVQESMPTAVIGSIVGESAPPVIRERLSPDGDVNLDDLLRPGAAPRNALLSMADVVFLNTRCIGWLLMAHRRVRKQGGRLVLHSLRLMARETLQFLRLDRVLSIVDDETAALELLRTDPSPLGMS